MGVVSTPATAGATRGSAATIAAPAAAADSANPASASRADCNIAQRDANRFGDRRDAAVRKERDSHDQEREDAGHDR